MFGAENMIGHNTSLHPHGIAVPAFVLAPNHWGDTPKIEDPVSMVGLAKSIKSVISGDITDIDEFVTTWTKEPIRSTVDGPTWDISALQDAFGNEPKIKKLSVRKVGIVENDLQTVYTSYWGSSEIQTQTYRINSNSREIVNQDPAKLDDHVRQWLLTNGDSTDISPSARLKALGYV
jgi:hypothetical protein